MKIKDLYRKYSRDEHTKEIVEAIGKIGFVLVLGAVAPNAAGHIMKLLGWVPDYKNKKITDRAVMSLKKRGLLIFGIKDGKTVVRLTEAGKWYYKRLEIESMQLPRSKTWDQVWTLVTFDIPETKSVNRRHFYKTMMILGMYNLEKSVFAYPYECHKEVEAVAEVFLVSKHVRYIRASYVQSDRQLRNFFDLKS